MRIWLGLVLGAASAAVVACGAARSKSSGAAPPTVQASQPAEAPADAASPTSAMPPSRLPRSEIEARERAIDDAMARAGIAPPVIELCSGARCATMLVQPMVTPTLGQAGCNPPGGEKCMDACVLSVEICDDQDKICNLARQLGDDWAANKCERARASCKAANERCCSCVR